MISGGPGLPQGRQSVDLELALWQEKFDALDSSRHDSYTSAAECPVRLG